MLLLRGAEKEASQVDCACHRFFENANYAFKLYKGCMWKMQFGSSN